MSDERPAKRSRYSTKVVTVAVGTNPVEEFSIHEDVLKTSSPFFKAALEKCWKEGQTLRINLPDDTPEIFTHYLDYVYDGRLNLPCTPREVTTLDMLHKKHELLARLYVYGEKIQDDKFCDSAMVAIAAARHEKNNENDSITWGSADALMILIAGTPSNSPARRYFVDFFANFMSSTWEISFNFLVKKMPDFAVDIMRKTFQLRENNAFQKREAFSADISPYLKQSQKAASGGT